MTTPPIAIHPLMDDALVGLVAGLLTTGLGTMGVFTRNAFNALRDRIIKLEADVEDCQKSRLADNDQRLATERQLGEMTATVANLREQIARYAGAPRSVRLRANHRGEIVDASPNVEAVLGFPLSAIVGQKADVLVPEELRDSHENAFRNRANDPEIKPGHTTLRQSHVRHAVGGVLPARIVLQEQKGRNGFKEFVVEITRLDAF